MKKVFKNRCGSLLTITLDYIVNNLSLYSETCIQMFPAHIKDRILKKISTSSYFWKNLELENILNAILHKNTTHLNLTMIQTSDNILNIAQKCTNLKELFLTSVNDCSLSSEGLIKLFKCTPNLSMLYLTNCNACNDEVLETLSKHCSHLNGLDIGGCKNVTDNGMKALSSLKHLNHITLSQTKVTDDGITTFVEGNSGANLVELRIDDCPNIVKDVTLSKIAEYCPNLEILLFYATLNTANTNNQTVPCFPSKKLPNLKQLSWSIFW